MFLSNVLKNYKGLPEEATYLIYASIMPSVVYGLLFTDLSYYLTAIQGVPADFMGIVITSMGVSAFVASIILGIAADVFGRKKMIIGGTVLASLIIVVFAFTADPVILILAALLEGISEGAVFSSTTALLADKAQNKKRNSVFSLHAFAQSIAFGIGSFAVPAVLVFELYGFSEVESHILLYVSVAILNLISTILLLKVQESAKLKKTRKKMRDLLPGKSKNVLFKYTFTGAIIAFGAGLVVPLMTLWFHLQYGISDAISAPILAVSSLLIGIATLTAPYLAEKLGLIKAIFITQIASTIFMFIIPFSPTYALAGFVYGMRALLMNMATPLSQSMIMGLVAEDERGSASGITGALWRLPNALSTFIGAWLMGIGLLIEPFFIAGLFYVVSIMLFWYFFRKVKMPEEHDFQ